MTLRVYIAGPMTGIKDYNRMAFAEAASKLWHMGHEPVNPHDVCVGIPDGDWNACMRADIAALMTCDAVALLPGWINSKGARLEHDIATRLSMACRSVEGFERVTVPLDLAAKQEHSNKGVES